MKISTKFLAIASILALLSACETAPGANGGANGAGGAGGPSTPGTQGDLEQNVGDRVFFDYDSSVINSEGQAVLQKQAEWLKKYNGLSVTIEGHCDERGTREYNLALGERRASATKNYLVSLGVPASHIQTTSFGKERPAVVGADESAWSQNRRAVTVVSGQ